MEETEDEEEEEGRGKRMKKLLERGDENQRERKLFSFYYLMNHDIST